MKYFVQIVVVFSFLVPCYAQKNNHCDYDTGDSSFRESIMQLSKQDEMVKKGLMKTIKDTLGLDSLVLTYYETKQLHYRRPFKNGRCCGWSEDYYSNGQLCNRVYFIDGLPEDGYCYVYEIDGSIYKVGKYKNGVPNGDWITYVFRKPFKKYTYSSKGKLKKVKHWDVNKKRWKKTGFHYEVIETETIKYENWD